MIELRLTWTPPSQPGEPAPKAHHVMVTLADHRFSREVVAEAVQECATHLLARVAVVTAARDEVWR